MSHIRVEVSGLIPVRPEVVYAVLADYRVGHPAILPKPYFTELTVERGGRGAGTQVRTRLVVMGVARTFQLTVSEPEPGRVLMEADEQAGVVTTFTVEPLDDGQQTRVIIVTEAQTSPGLLGVLEQWLNPPIMRRIYNKELQQLAEVVRQPKSVTSSRTS